MSNGTLGEQARRADAMAHLPDAKATRPATILESGIAGLVRTWIIRTIRQPDQGFAVFIQVAGDGEVTQLLVPDEACRAIYRQREQLVDRSTPASRARKRATAEREKARKAKAAKRAKREPPA